MPQKDPQDSLARKDKQQRALEQDRTRAHTNGDSKTEMGLDRTYATKTSYWHYQAGLEMESAG